MAATLKSSTHLETVHVLFIDVVGYAKLLVGEQRTLVQQLNEVVRLTPQFRKSEAAGKLIRIPVGDGMALVFFQSPEEPAQCAVEISRMLQDHPSIRVRMGIHSGPVDEVQDVNDRTNVAGVGINIAQRVMACGDAGHILVTSRVAEDLAQDRHWQPHLHELGEIAVKHGVRIRIVNLYTEELGNPQIPERVKQESEHAPKFFHRRKNLTLLIGLGAILMLTAFFLLHRASATKPEKSIAVLPFENLSDEKENAYFAGGIQDDVLTNLAKIGDLKVISRTSVMQYKGNPHTVREIGKTLGVAAVLEGSVRRSGNRVRVNVQLINTSNDQHIWAENYDRELTDVIAIQSDLALQIASNLQSRLSPTEKARLQQRPTESGEAYLTYLQAQDRLTRSQSRDDLENVAQLYEKAIQLDPSFALALARLSYVEGTLYEATGDPSSLDRARAAANEAIRLQPALPEAHLALGYVYYRGNRDYDAALRELALAKNGLPNDPDIFLVVGSIERRQGNWSQSTVDLEKAASVNPKDASLWANLATNYQSLRDFPKAAKALDRGLVADPNYFMNHYLRARLDVDWKGDTGLMERLLVGIPEGSDPDGEVTLARFQFKLLQRKYEEAVQALNKNKLDSFSAWGLPSPIPKPFLLAQAYQLLSEEAKAHASFEDARQILEGAVHENPLDASRHALLGQVYAGLGLKDQAIQEGKRAVELLPESKDALDGPAMTLVLAQIYTMVGELDSAIPLLEHSLSSPAGVTIPALQIDPVWDPLRADPRFKKILAAPAHFKTTQQTTLLEVTYA